MPPEVVLQAVVGGGSEEEVRLLPSAGGKGADPEIAERVSNIHIILKRVNAIFHDCLCTCASLVVFDHSRSSLCKMFVVVVVCVGCIFGPAEIFLRNRVVGDV